MKVPTYCRAWMAANCNPKERWSREVHLVPWAGPVRLGGPPAVARSDVRRGGRMKFYKATEPDSVSFRDGVTKWRVGRITRLDGKPGTQLCRAGLLHASTELGEVLVGGSWPCRIFEVEPRSKLVTAPEHPYKVGGTAWKVMRELPSWMALGPNGESVAAHIERCKTLTEAEAVQLAAAWSASWSAAGYAAWDDARHAAHAAYVAHAAYAAANAAAHAAEDAVRDAAGALVVRDLITEEQFDTLYGPWASVIGSEA